MLHHPGDVEELGSWVRNRVVVGIDELENGVGTRD